jgi:hypothetical protein
MRIRDVIKKWPHLNWGGSGSDRIGLPNPTTTLIKDVSDVSDRQGNKIRIDAEADNQPVSDKLLIHAVVFFPEKAMFDRVFTALKSAIGKTLNDAENISI